MAEIIHMSQDFCVFSRDGGVGQGRQLKGEELAALLVQRCGIEAHPRSILRRLRQEEKKRR